MKSFELKSVKELGKAAKYIAGQLKKTPLCLLYGEMGSGKTTLVSEICKAINASGNISSPTFTIINEYKLYDGEPVYHIDLYRIKNTEEAVDAGVEECISSSFICMIEWPEIVEDIAGTQYLKVEIAVAENGIRQIYVKEVIS